MSDLESTMFPHLRFYVQLDRESKSSGYIAQWITMHSGCTHPDLLMHLTCTFAVVLCHSYLCYVSEARGHVSEVRLMYCDGRA